MKTALFVVPRLIALTIVLFFCFALASAAVGLSGRAQPTADAGAAAATLLAVCLLDATVVSYLILRSRWTGWRLIGVVAFVCYGVMTFMGQIESAVFITHLPAGTLPRLFLMGVLIAVPFAALAVPILGKARAAEAAVERNARLVMPRSGWARKLAVIILAYVLLYFTFGYFVAWRNPAVREYYRGTDPGSFQAQMASVLRHTPWLVPLQIGRATGWTVFAVPVVRMLKGGRLETTLAIGLLFAVLMNAQLLLPNPYMPEAVRMAHLRETASSNFVFGALVGWLLSGRRVPALSASGAAPVRGS